MISLINHSKLKIESDPQFCNISEENGLDLDISVTCTVEYRYETDRQKEVAEKCGLKAEDINKLFLEKAKDNTNSALSMAFAIVSGNKLSYQKLKQSGEALAETIKDQLYSSWRELHGVEIFDVIVSDIKASESDEKTISSFANASPATKTAAPVVMTPASWKCVCSFTSQGNFCPNCGRKKPSGFENGWKCAKCSTDNYGRFCTECGSAYEPS